MARERHFGSPDHDGADIGIGHHVADHGVDPLGAIQIPNHVVAALLHDLLDYPPLRPQGADPHVIGGILYLQNIVIKLGPVLNRGYRF